MKTDSLKQYIELRQALLEEKAELQNRLTQIDQVLEGKPVAAQRGPKPTRAARAPKAPRAPRKPVPRLQNKMSLREAVTKVTSAKPLTKKEILEGVKGLGYRFASKDPMNSLSVMLYTSKHFKNDGGKWRPVAK